jgi:enamine deaminase RidA (YjgF/YER057c/UK114 family)
MNTREVVYPRNPHALYDRHGYSPAVKANGLLFVSGQVGAREDGEPEQEYEDEVRLAFTNLEAILEAAGCTFNDVVDVTILMVDPEAHLETALRVLGEFWGEKPYPTLTAAGVVWLAGFRFEIKVVANLPGTS